MNKRMKFISLNIGIITISDTRSEENDKSGKVLYDAIIDSKHNVFNNRFFIMLFSFVLFVVCNKINILTILVSLPT